MSVSVACDKGKHDKCLRRSCSCYCGHAHLGTVEERDRVLADLPSADAPLPTLEPVTQRYELIPIGNVHAGPNVRVAITDLDKLTESVRRYGILEPLVGCPADGGGVEVLMGQRRLAAANAAGLDEVPVLIRPRPTERDRLIMQLAENLERADMTPIEEAKTLAQLVSEGLTQEEAGRAANRSVMWANTRLQLLRMPPCLQDALHERAVTPTVALSIPRSLFLDDEAVTALREACGSNEALRSWAHAATIRLSDKGTVKGGYALERPVSLPVEYVQLASAAAKAVGVSTRSWIRDVIEDAARAVGVELPPHVKKIERVERPARARK